MFFMEPAVRATVIPNLMEGLEVIPAPGLRPIKQVEMHKKWRPLLPEWAKDITCPKPSQAVLDEVNKEKNSKRKNKRKASAMKRDDDKPTPTESFQIHHVL